jgi:hypothetical protein
MPTRAQAYDHVYRVGGQLYSLSCGEIKFNIYGEGRAFKFQPCLKVCNTFNVNYVPPHRRFIKEEPNKKEEPERKETKIKEVVAFVKTKE